jgi:hypothetical protein
VHGLWNPGVPEQAAQAGVLAEGVIDSSACVNTIGGNPTPVETAGQFAAEFRKALEGLGK